MHDDPTAVKAARGGVVHGPRVIKVAGKEDRDSPDPSSPALAATGKLHGGLSLMAGTLRQPPRRATLADADTLNLGARQPQPLKFPRTIELHLTVFR